MRISCDQTDAGYAAWNPSLTGKVHVFIDGQEVRRAITADDQEGIIVTVKFDANGHPVVNAARDAVERETLRGNVEIRIYQ